MSTSDTVTELEFLRAKVATLEQMLDDYERAVDTDGTAELEHMRIAQALRESEARYARATAAGKVGVWELDVARGVYHGDLNLKALLGYECDELGTDPLDWLHLVHPDDQGMAADQWFRVAAGQTETYHCELRMIHKTGTVIWTEVRGQAVRGGNGSIQSVLGSTVDITERRTAEAALREREESLRKSERDLRLILNALPVGVWLINGQGDVIVSNPAARQIWCDAAEHRSDTEDQQRWENRICRFPPHRTALERALTAGAPSLNETMTIECLGGTPKKIRYSAVPVREETGAVMGAIVVTEDLTEHTLLEEHAHLFRTLMECSSDIISVLNPDGTIRYKSPAFFRLFGYREEDVLGRNAFTFIHPDDVQRVMQIFQDRLLTPGLTEPVIFSFRKADGGYLMLEGVGNNLLLDPAVQGMVVNCREVTGRIRAEEALRASEAKLRALADHAPVSIFMSDPTGHCMYVNQRWCDMTGYTAPEAYGQGWLRTIPPGEPDPLSMRGTDAPPAPPLERETRFLTKCGTIRWAEVSIVPLRNAQQEITGFVSTSTDITERRRAQEELLNAHAFIRHIIDTDPNLIFAKDREGRFTLVNKAVADFYGTTVETLIGRTDADFNANAEEVAALRRQDLDVMDSLTERCIPEEILTDAAGNRRWLQTVKRPLMDEHGKASQVLGASTDITARKEVEEALRQREQDLQAALAERERISEELHDGLLQSLYGVGLGLETCKSLMTRDSKRAAETLERAVSQLNAVMREVRNFIAGLESELLQGGDLSRALRTVVESLAGPHGLLFRVAIDDQATRHISRERSLHVLNVVREAVSNSLRHSKASRGTVMVRRLKHVIRVTVTDNGIGFSPKAAIGVGHGLVNMAARARRVGGHLLIDSKPKRGTRIVFDLPKDIQHGRA